MGDGPDDRSLAGEEFYVPAGTLQVSGTSRPFVLLDLNELDRFDFTYNGKIVTLSGDEIWKEVAAVKVLEVLTIAVVGTVIFTAILGWMLMIVQKIQSRKRPHAK